MTQPFPTRLFWEASGNNLLTLLLATHLAQALAASVSHHSVFSTEPSQHFLHSPLSMYLMCSKWSRFRQLLHPGQSNGQGAVALHS